MELPPLPTATPTATQAPTPTARPFPVGCEDLVDSSLLVDIVAAPLRGERRRVYVGPLPSVGRLQRLTCGYGVNSKGVATIEITLNEYRDAATARERVRLTVSAATRSDQRVEGLRIGSEDGYVIADPATISAVLAVAEHTAVVTLRRRTVTMSAEPVVLEGLMVAALRLEPSEVPPAAGSATSDAGADTPGTAA